MASRKSKSRTEAQPAYFAHRPELARLLRAALRRRGELLAADPWLPVPQTGCPFEFGVDRAVLPFAAMWRIFERIPHADGDCWLCGGDLFPFLVGGIDVFGGLKAVCLACGAIYYQFVGPPGAVARHVAPALAGTPYDITACHEDTVHAGLRWPLWDALAELGERDLPPPAWRDGMDPAEPWFKPMFTPGKRGPTPGETWVHIFGARDEALAETRSSTRRRATRAPS